MGENDSSVPETLAFKTWLNSIILKVCYSLFFGCIDKLRHPHFAATKWATITHSPSAQGPHLICIENEKYVPEINVHTYIICLYFSLPRLIDSDLFVV